MPETRIVPVDRQFYVELSKYLLSEERWMQRVEGGNYGLVVLVPTMPDGSTKQLIFLPK